MRLMSSRCYPAHPKRGAARSANTLSTVLIAVNYVKEESSAWVAAAGRLAAFTQMRRTACGVWAVKVAR